MDKNTFICHRKEIDGRECLGRGRVNIKKAYIGTKVICNYCADNIKNINKRKRVLENKHLNRNKAFCLNCGKDITTRNTTQLCLSCIRKIIKEKGFSHLYIYYGKINELSPYFVKIIKNCVVKGGNKDEMQILESMPRISRG